MTKETQIWTILENTSASNSESSSASGLASSDGHGHPVVSSEHPDIQAAAKLLREGELVAFPTETVYGLGADATNTSAVEAIYHAKGRPSDNPLIVHIAERSQLDELIADSVSQEERELAERLIARFWPGPLTLVLPVRPGAVSPRVTAGLATVAVRMPDHPLALALIRASGRPIAAPSANRSGRPSPTTARHVAEDLAGRIAGIIDGGPTTVGLESTVVAILPRGLELLRPGGVTQQQLREAAPDVPLRAPELPSAAAQPIQPDEAPRSPGMKYAHYAPRGEMRVILGGSSPASRAAVIDHAASLLAEAKRQGRRTGVLTYAEHEGRYHGVDHIAVCGSLRDLRTVARQLYDALRSFDEAGIDFIVAEGCPAEGVGEAIMNRLIKAAAYRIERVEARS